MVGVPQSSAPALRASAWGDGLSLSEIAESAGLQRIHILAWRDLDDPEAGGSELHSHRIATLWAQAGLDVTMRTSVAQGHPTYTYRDGYRVVRKAGRYMVFPRTALSGRVGRTGPRDAMVEVWNGMPFFSPAWARCPRVVFLHHVHAEMWRMVLPPNLARLGELIEFRIAPPVYRNTRIVTLSESSRTEIVEMLGLPATNISVVSPGVEDRFSPGGTKAPYPLVVAVGRLVPVKRFDVLIDSLCQLKERHPGLEAVIVGEGYERAALERKAGEARADWVHLPGSLSDEELVSLYRRAWVLASSSARGMGDDDHRGGSLRDPRRRHSHSGPPRRRRSRCERVAGVGPPGADLPTRRHPVRQRLEGASGVRSPREERCPHLGGHRPGNAHRSGRRGGRAPGPSAPASVGGSSLGGGRPRRPYSTTTSATRRASASHARVLPRVMLIGHSNSGG